MLTNPPLLELNSNILIAKAKSVAPHLVLNSDCGSVDGFVEATNCFYGKI